MICVSFENRLLDAPTYRFPNSTPYEHGVTTLGERVVVCSDETPKVSSRVVFYNFAVT